MIKTAEDLSKFIDSMRKKGVLEFKISEGDLHFECILGDKPESNYKKKQEPDIKEKIEDPISEADVMFWSSTAFDENPPTEEPSN